MRRRILAVNINDFGGTTGHLMNHRYFNNRDRKYHIDWKYWAKQLDKTEIWVEWKRYVERKNPDILIFEEMLVSCYENIDFIGELEEIHHLTAIVLSVGKSMRK